MNTLKCPYCGEEIPQSMQFCPHCMTALGDVTELEVKSLHKGRKSVIVVVALLICAVIGVYGYFILHENNNKSVAISSTNDFSIEDISSSSMDISESFINDSTENSTSNYYDSHETESSDFENSSDIEIEEISEEPQTDSKESSAASSENEDISNSSFEDTNRPQDAADGLTKESFINLITSYCDSHDTEFFGLNDTSDLNYEENGEGISIDFTDDSGAMIFIDTDKEIEHCELYFRAGQQASVEHCEEILYVMGDMLFGCDLSGKDGIFTEGDYRFNIGSYYMPELFYCEYYATADRVS